MTENTPVPVKSCATCPSFLGSSDMDQQVKAYNAIYKAPTCTLKGKLLGGPNAPAHVNTRIQEAVARTCESHGKPVPRSAAPVPTVTVALPMPQLNYDGDGAKPVQPRSCRTCLFFIPPDFMQEQIGMTAGLCARNGTLISDQSTSKIAERCTVGEHSSFGAAAHADSATANKMVVERYEAMLADVMILPELAPALKLGKMIGANLPEAEPDFIDPTQYLTDKDVSDEDKSHGIRAWRKYFSDDGSKSVMLPVFDINFFSPDEQAKIPRTGDQNHPEKYRDHQNLGYKCAVAWHLQETPALHGVAGTGKTEFFRKMAYDLCLPFERVSITASSEIDDLAGKTHYTPEKGTFFEKGRIPRAWAKPCVQVIDEPNVGSPAVWQFIRPMTDNAKQLVLDMNEGEVVNRHKYSFLGMAMNPAWDFRNTGTEVISDADGSRLLHMFVEFPDKKIEREIIRQRCLLDGFKIDSDDLTKIMDIAEALRGMSQAGALPITWGIRQQIKVARVLAWVSMADAYRMAAADYIEPQARQLIIDQVNLKNPPV